MSYVDGYVIPIPKKNLKAYARMARMGAEAWLKPGETAVFSYIVFKSRVHRDRVNAKVMKEMEEKMCETEMPFDMKRMVYGGFKTLVEM